VKRPPFRTKVVEFRGLAELYVVDEGGLELFVGYLAGPRRERQCWGGRFGVEVSS